MSEFRAVRKRPDRQTAESSEIRWRKQKLKGSRPWYDEARSKCMETKELEGTI